MSCVYFEYQRMMVDNLDWLIRMMIDWIPMTNFYYLDVDIVVSIDVYFSLFVEYSQIIHVVWSMVVKVMDEWMMILIVCDHYYSMESSLLPMTLFQLFEHWRYLCTIKIDQIYKEKSWWDLQMEWWIWLKTKNLERWMKKNLFFFFSSRSRRWRRRWW